MSILTKQHHLQKGQDRDVDMDIAVKISAQRIIMYSNKFHHSFLIYEFHISLCNVK
jgi:hypothetical protein